MEIGDWAATPDLNDIYREIRGLGLETQLAELEAYGFTIIENALSPEMTIRMRDRLIELAEVRLGRSLDLLGEIDQIGQQYAHYLLFEDPMFKEAVLNTKTLVLITYLLGKRCILSSFGSVVKGPGGDGLGLHCDMGNGAPDPLPPYAGVANVNFVLTDYTEERGALAMVPGSHRHQRQPAQSEKAVSGNYRNPHAIPIEVPAGSAVVFHGNTWHGSFPRTVPGLRVMLLSFFCREFIQPQEDRTYVPEGFLDGHRDDRLARLLGRDLIHGWRTEGPERFYARRVEIEQAPAARTWQS